MKRLLLGRHMRRAWLAAIAAGLVAAAAPWLDRLRPVPLERQAVYELLVTSEADEGIGTLRDAIFTADRRDARVRIVIQTRRIVLRTPLPPVVNPYGVVFESRGEGTEIDGRAASGGPVLDISAPNTVITGMRIEGAPSEAILIRASGARLTHVAVRHAATGIYLVDGMDDLTVRDSQLEENLVGIHVAPAASRVDISSSRFRRHRRAGVWAVSADESPIGRAPGLTIHENRFEDDEDSLVLINVPARVERNSFVGARTAAMLITGASTVVRANRVRSGVGFGINADRLDRSLISENEVDHNCAGGILVRSARNTQVLSNRLYANGYGIVIVMGAPASPNTVADNLVMRHFDDGLYVIGGSPVIRRNRVLNNLQAGLRFSSLRLETDRWAVPDPLLDANVVGGNGNDAPRWDEYRPSLVSLPADSSRDCSWRMNQELSAASRP